MVIALLFGCGGDGAGVSGQPTAGAANSSCTLGAELTGANYDVAKSKFAFGSATTRSVEGTMTRYTGTDGVLAIESSGYATGILNASASEAGLPDWQGPVSLAQHVEDYFVSMGVAPCQVGRQDTLGSGGGSGAIGSDGTVTMTTTYTGSSTVELNRTVDGIPVIGSLAYARFDANDETTEEGFYWPTVPAAVVSSARALRDQLTDPAALAAYKAKLPANAQDVGQVVIHHSSGLLLTDGTFRALASYDVLEAAGVFGRSSTLSFDADGKPVELPL